MNYVFFWNYVDAPMTLVAQCSNDKNSKMMTTYIFLLEILLKYLKFKVENKQ